MTAFALTYVSIAHIVAVVFAIIELGLTAYIANTTRSAFFSFPRVNFMIFNSVWTLLVLIYVAVTPLYLANLHHKLAATVVTTVTAIFWFAGSIALAVISGGGVTAAAVAFGFFLWVIFTGLAALDLLETRRGTTSSVKTGPAANPGV
ncbi:hypothetical protein UCREL1_7074 [Eutypa lata UCREL1]|uniref:MARVEL domain-containing protein n=1 Tax=Eutypa lata (strain UCR-EL1) TaxID=1287681 RepID=M7T813_EUTLA|nr:hypothetical protein UCREL1_7074 [Eutypa lata UCREL1]